MEHPPITIDKGCWTPWENLDPKNPTRRGENEGPEILVVYEGATTTEIALVSKAPISKEFRQHLEGFQNKLSPSIFPDKDWKDLMLQKRKKKLAVATIDKNDLEIIWKEVLVLAERNSYKDFTTWLHAYYYLSCCVLQAKIDSLKKGEADLSSDEVLHQILKDAKRMLTYQLRVTEEMMHRYMELVNEKDIKTSHRCRCRCE